jgi:hypothetical protein
MTALIMKRDAPTIAAEPPSLPAAKPSADKPQNPHVESDIRASSRQERVVEAPAKPEAIVPVHEPSRSELSSSPVPARLPVAASRTSALVPPPIAVRARESSRKSKAPRTIAPTLDAGVASPAPVKVVSTRVDEAPASIRLILKYAGRQLPVSIEIDGVVVKRKSGPPPEAVAVAPNVKHRIVMRIWREDHDSRSDRIDEVPVEQERVVTPGPGETIDVKFLVDYRFIEKASDSLH